MILLAAACRVAVILGKFRKRKADLFCLKMPVRLIILSVLLIKINRLNSKLESSWSG